MALSFKEVAEILKIIDASQCEEVIVEVEDTRLVVRRGGATHTNAGQSAATEAPEPTGGPVIPASAQAAEIAIDETQTLVRSPMVGTFYRRPSPSDSPFVEIGAKVKKGDPLCLLEVMKLYTTIEAPANGIVVAIHAEDNMLVEFDQILFAIK